MQTGEVSRAKWARLLSLNQIREIVMDPDSDEEKYYASADTEDEEEPRPSSRWSSSSQPPSPDFSASSLIKVGIFSWKHLAKFISILRRNSSYETERTKPGINVHSFVNTGILKTLFLLRGLSVVNSVWASQIKCKKIGLNTSCTSVKKFVRTHTHTHTHARARVNLFTVSVHNYIDVKHNSVFIIKA